MIVVTSPFSKSSIFKMFYVQTKAEIRRFQILPAGLKSVFEKLRFRDGLVRYVGLTINRRNKVSVVWTGPNNLK